MKTGESLRCGITVDAVRAERIAQGLPATIADPEALALIGAVLRAARAEIKAAA
jgi:hypothetical protein